MIHDFLSFYIVVL